ncbi:hypothetical protein MMC22_004860 [Lobaria immixta]|nr:hypothetical protein [Lobaria immixta]
MSAITSLEHNVDNLKSAVHSSLAQISSNGFSSRRPPMLKEYVSNQIRKELSFTSLQRPECGYSTTKSAVFIHESARNQKGSYQEQYTTLESQSPISGRCERTESSPEDIIYSKPKRHLNILSSYKTSFGTILRSTEEREMNPDLSYLITEIFLLPASWLLSTGFVITITRIVSAYTRPTLTYSLRPIEIITNTNRVLGAMLEGDLLKVREHFTNRVASPFATFSNGVNSLHVLTCMMFNVSVGTFSYNTELHDWSDISGGPLTEWGQQDPRQVQTQWENYKSMFTWLRSLGVDVGAGSDSGRTPMQCLFRILRLDTDSFDEENLFHLAISSIEAAKNNPLYGHHSGEIGGTLRKCLHGEELLLINCPPGRILESKEWTICTDDGQCVATTIILDDICPPLVAESPDWKTWIPVEHIYRWSIDLFSHLSQVENRLIKNIIDGIPTSKNSELDLSFVNAITILFRTIITALLRGSPLKVFNRCSVDKGFVRQSIIEDVACMLPADPLLTTFHFDGDTIAIWARKWRVLDIWREAPFKRGFGSADVNWLTAKAWREDKHLYYKT